MSVFNRARDVEKRRRLRKNMTPEELLVWYQLRNGQLSGVRFRRQYSVAGFVIDFYAPALQLAIEIDGSQHFTVEGAAYDRERTDILHGYGIHVIRFTNLEVQKELQAVLEMIDRLISNPSLQRRGWGGVQPSP